jgi:SAM-dependent methyltransferase
MGHQKCFEFGERILNPAEIAGKDVLEVGACMDGGSMRPYFESHHPRSYVGVDIQSGPGVDVVCDAMDMHEEFGENAFDIVITNELLEHIRDWRKLIHILKTVLRPGGVLIITTRSFGFPFHYAPFDFWRYEQQDMRDIFADCEILALESDTRTVRGRVTPGVFVAVRKPGDFCERDTGEIALYSILKDQRVKDITNLDIFRYEVAELGLAYFWRHRGIPYLLREYLSRKLLRPLRA